MCWFMQVRTLERFTAREGHRENVREAIVQVFRAFVDAMLELEDRWDLRFQGRERIDHSLHLRGRGVRFEGQHDDVPVNARA